MPHKVYMPEELRSGGGTCFHVTWDRIEGFLRGCDDLAGTSARLESNESCEFVVTATGLNVYVVSGERG